MDRSAIDEQLRAIDLALDKTTGPHVPDSTIGPVEPADLPGGTRGEYLRRQLADRVARWRDGSLLAATVLTWTQDRTNPRSVRNTEIRRSILHSLVPAYRDRLAAYAIQNIHESVATWTMYHGANDLDAPEFIIFERMAADCWYPDNNPQSPIVEDATAYHMASVVRLPFDSDELRAAAADFSDATVIRLAVIRDHLGQFAAWHTRQS